MANPLVETLSLGEPEEGLSLGEPGAFSCDQWIRQRGSEEGERIALTPTKPTLEGGGVSYSARDLTR